MFEVQYYFGEFGCIINIYQQRGPGPNNWYIAKSIQLEWEKLDDTGEKAGISQGPTLKLNHIEGDFLLAAFKKTLTRSENDKGRLEGKIEAMEKHIEDLERLLRIDKSRMIRPDGGTT